MTALERVSHFRYMGKEFEVGSLFNDTRFKQLGEMKSVGQRRYRPVQRHRRLHSHSSALARAYTTDSDIGLSVPPRS
jgi:hypothetical protein